MLPFYHSEALSTKSKKPHYVWSVRTTLNIGSDGRVPIGTQRLRIEKPPQTKVVLCLHPTGHHSVLATAPDPHQKPVLIFTNRHQ